MIKKFHIKKILNFGEEISQIEDVVAIEEPLEINLKSTDDTIFPVSVTMRTPGNDEELALGFLFQKEFYFLN